MERISNSLRLAEFFLNLKSHFGALRAAHAQLGKEVDELKVNSLLIAKELEHHREELNRQDNRDLLAELRIQNALLAQEIGHLRERLQQVEHRADLPKVVPRKNSPKRLSNKRSGGHPNA